MNSKGMTGIAAGLMIVGTAFGQCGGMKAASGCGGEQRERERGGVHGASPMGRCGDSNIDRGETGA